MSLIKSCLLHIAAPKNKDIKEFYSKHFSDVYHGIAPEEVIRNQFFYSGNLCAENIIASGHSEILNENTIEFLFYIYKVPPIDQIKSLIKEYYDYEFHLEVCQKDFDSRYTLEGKCCQIIETTYFDNNDHWEGLLFDEMQAEACYEGLLQFPQDKYDEFINFTNLNRANLNKLDKTKHQKFASDLFKVAKRYDKQIDQIEIDDDELF